MNYIIAEVVKSKLDPKTASLLPDSLIEKITAAAILVAPNSDPETIVDIAVNDIAPTAIYYIITPAEWKYIVEKDILTIEIHHDLPPVYIKYNITDEGIEIYSDDVTCENESLLHIIFSLMNGDELQYFISRALSR